MQPEYLAMTGSRLYGYSTPESDYDYRGFYIPEKRNLFGLPGLPANNIEGPGDTVIYPLKDFLFNIANGNTSLCEILFTPKDQVKTITKIGEHVLFNKYMLLSKKFYKSIRGYAYAELRKAKCVELVENKADNRVKKMVEFCSAFNLDGNERLDVIDIIQKSVPDFQPFAETSSVNTLGGKRKASYEQHGYCTKNAAHCIRLLLEGHELLTNGKITFPLSYADILKDIRDGKRDIDSIEGLYKELDTILTKAYESSSLPDSPNFDQIYDLYFECLKMKGY